MLPDGRSVVNLTAHMAVTVCVAVRSVQTAAAFTLTTTVAAVIVVAAAAATAAATGVTGPSLLCHLAVCLVLQLVLCQTLAEASNLLPFERFLSSSARNSFVLHRGGQQPERAGPKRYHEASLSRVGSFL